MMCSVVYVCFAMLVPWLGHSPSALRIRPATLVGRIQIGESKTYSNRRQVEDSAEKTSCRKFVGEFYAWYIARGKNGDLLRVALRRKKANFSLEVIRRLSEDAKAVARSPNEIVGLDFDPVLNSQDFAEKYVPGKVSQKGSRFLVDVFSVYAGKRSEVPAVTAELRYERGRWVFSNFIYKSDGKTDDLLSLLRRLKADRKKSS
jgi:hypothetical protein